MTDKRSDHPDLCEVDIIQATWEAVDKRGGWEGGMLARLNDGRHAYFSGWRHRTGWFGISDGGDVCIWDHSPLLTELPADAVSVPKGANWNFYPVAVGRALAMQRGVNV